MSETVLSVSISSPSTTDSRDDGEVVLHVEDAMSGEVLVDLHIPTGRWWRLCQGSHQNHIGFVSSHLERVGKKDMHEEIRVPAEIIAGHYEREKIESLIRAWLAAGNQPDYWETVRIDHHNYGWAVLGRWWIDPTAEEVAEFRTSRHLY